MGSLGYAIRPCRMCAERTSDLGCWLLKFLLFVCLPTDGVLPSALFLLKTSRCVKVQY